MGVYARHVLPRVLDRACAAKPVTHQRRKIIPLAEGRVVEIGIGSGLNLPFYDPKRVTHITGIDPDAHIWERGRVRRAACPIPIDRLGLSGEAIPLETAYADTVVVTYALCTIPDPVRAVGEMRRILRPGGSILFSEHGLAPDAGVARWQDRLQPVWGRLAGGCHLGRDIPAILRAAGCRAEMERGYIPGPKFASYTYWGRAVPA